VNERIKELFKRAGGKSSTRNLMSNPVQVVETHELWDDRIDKFAELIVRECADVLVAEMNRLDGLDRVVASQTMDTAQVLIKLHFGVEE
jgi:hypothetical protein